MGIEMMGDYTAAVETQRSHLKHTDRRKPRAGEHRAGLYRLREMQDEGGMQSDGVRCKMPEDAGGQSTEQALLSTQFKLQTQSSLVSRSSH